MRREGTHRSIDEADGSVVLPVVAAWPDVVTGGAGEEVREADAEAEGTEERHGCLEGDVVVTCLEARDAAVRDAEPLRELALAEQVGAADVA